MDSERRAIDSKMLRRPVNSNDAVTNVINDILEVPKKMQIGMQQVITTVTKDLRERIFIQTFPFALCRRSGVLQEFLLKTVVLGRWSN
jgi:hypothetical protein